MASGYAFGVDQGTSGKVAVLLDDEAGITAFSDKFPVSQSYPRKSWAETDPAEILRSFEGAIASVVRAAGIKPRRIRCCGLANHGETIVAFDRRTGESALQAALFGRGCLAPGATKMTSGIGCFILTNLGRRSILRSQGLLISVAWKLGAEACHIVDGGVYCSGSLVRWLPDVSGSRHGLGLSVTRADLSRAAVESIAFPDKDIIDALGDVSAKASDILVSCGLSGSRFFMQFQADLLGKPLRVLRQREATALGAALMAGVASGMWGADEVARRAEGNVYNTIIPNPANTRPADSYRRRRTAMRGVTETAA